MSKRIRIRAPRSGGLAKIRGAILSRFLTPKRSIMRLPKARRMQKPRRSVSVASAPLAVTTCLGSLLPIFVRRIKASSATGWRHRALPGNSALWRSLASAVCDRGSYLAQEMDPRRVCDCRWKSDRPGSSHGRSDFRSQPMQYRVSFAAWLGSRSHLPAHAGGAQMVGSRFCFGRFVAFGGRLWRLRDDAGLLSRQCLWHDHVFVLQPFFEQLRDTLAIDQRLTDIQAFARFIDVLSHKGLDVLMRDLGRSPA